MSTDIIISDTPQVEREEPCPHCLICDKDALPMFHEDSCKMVTDYRRRLRKFIERGFDDHKYIELAEA